MSHVVPKVKMCQVIPCYFCCTEAVSCCLAIFVDICSVSVGLSTLFGVAIHSISIPVSTQQLTSLASYRFCDREHSFEVQLACIVNADL